MTLLFFKLLAALSIMLLTLLAGFLPLRLAKRNKQIFHLGDAFASGIFLSAALIHLLPDANAAFAKVYGSEAYPYAALYCVLAFVSLLFMERGVAMYSKYRAQKLHGGAHEVPTASHHEHQHEHEGANENINCACICHLDEHKNFLTPLLLVLVLSVHSFVEGAAIGISASFAGAMLIYFAVIVHKGAESLALSSNLHRYEMKPHHINRFLVLFAFMTPLGILLASAVNHAVNNACGQLLEAIFNAVAAGTFLYLGTVHVMECDKSFENFGEITALLLGIVIMSLAAIWV